MSDDGTQAPILDFDPDRTAIIEPGAFQPKLADLPHRCVVTWMDDAFARFEELYPLVHRHDFTLESGSTPIYELTIDGETVLLAKALVGAPVTATLFETLIALGATTFVAVGSSGGLVPELAPGTIVIPDAAIRDEGVSYHYAPAALLAHPDAQIQAVLRETFAAAGNQVARGTTWTTDAFFRETKAKVALRIDQGAIAVDMEAAALATIAQFRQVRLGHALYLADTLHSDEWDPTELIQRDTDFRSDLLMTAARACATLP